MTHKRLRQAAVLFVGLALLAAPAARAFPSPVASGEPLRVLEMEASGLLSGVWNLLSRLLPGLEVKNRISIDPDGASASQESDNRAGIDPDGASASQESDNRASIDPDG